MFYDKFIHSITLGNYSTFKGFEKAANEAGIFFQKLGHENIIYTDINKEKNTVCYDFFSKININIQQNVHSNFNFKKFFSDKYKEFIEDEYNKIAKFYDINMKFDHRIQTYLNIKNLFDKINCFVLRKEDFEFFSYFLLN